MLCCPVRAYLGLGQAQPAGQLLPLRSDHVVILLEGPFQTEQLRWREGRPDAFGLPGERAVEEEVLRTVLLTWKHPQRNTPSVIPLPAPICQLATVLIAAKQTSRLQLAWMFTRCGPADFPEVVIRFDSSPLRLSRNETPPLPI